MPWVLFGDSISEQDLIDQGIFPVVYAKPVVQLGKIAVPLAIELVDGLWTQLWVVRDATSEEIEMTKPRVPSEVSMRQARLALLAKGLLDLVEPAIDSLEIRNREIARIEWDYSSTVYRHRPLVNVIGLKLGLDDGALDQLFITAAEL